MSEYAGVALAPTRHARILAALAEHGTIRSSELIAELGVTPVTLRRDLAQLELDGKLTRVHGGAVPTEGSFLTPQRSEREAFNDNHSIAVLVPTLDYYWPSIIDGIESEARRHGLNVQVRTASYETQDERPILERILRNDRPAGLIVAFNAGTEHSADVVKWLRQCGVPSVLAEREASYPPGGAPVEGAGSDHALGGFLAAQHLAQLGHRKVGLVVARQSPTSRKIAAGWYAACRDLGLAPTQHFETLLPHRNTKEFSVAVNATLDRALELGMTALLVHSDPEAMAFVDMALNRGLAVPGDLSLMSYDDEVAERFTPALTAVRPPREAVGAAALDLLVRRIAEPDRPVHRVSLNPSLSLRSTTAPPQAPGAER
ncbi:substrate-binding domain-containing protein (plasmid) [Coraliomargarita sp. W4R53]